MPDFNALPLILAGPIVRRVEPTLVSVWIALSAARTVELALWVGEIVVPTASDFFGSAGAAHRRSTASIRIGEKLHFALATIDLTASPLIPGQNYAYNLVFTGPNNKDLSTEKYLEDKGPAIEPTRLALGYLAGRLPTFALPPAEIENLRIVHGSCRKAHGHGADGLVALDKVIERTRAEPLQRPHQLFLTGDQVYADDVPMMLLPQLTVAGNALLGAPETLPLTTSSGTQNVQVTTANFPTTWRQELVRQQARMSSGEASSHVLSFGEFCALYLFYWSNVLWDDFASKDTLFPECPDDRCRDANTIVSGLPAHLRDLYPPPPPGSSRNDRKDRIDDRNKLREDYKKQLEEVKTFKKALPYVQRVLANVPTYMIFDDHEVTDDWYLTQDWRDRVLTSPLGVTVVRNGLLSFALFQAWGNHPKRFETGDHAQLLTQAQALFPAAGGPVTSVANQIDTLFGLGGIDPKIDWHFTVPTGPTTTAVLDTRTRRSYVGRYNPPGLISAASLDAQLPASLAPSPGAELLFVVSAAPVLGLALIEEVAQPLGARGYADFFMSVIWNQTPKITGYMEFDMEAWSLDAPQLEALFARLNQFKKVVILSGDVHYSYSAEMDYWKRGQPTPTRFVQVTSSALKNEWSAVAKRSLETVTVQELLHKAFYPVARLGWDSPIDLVGRVNVPGGAIPRSKRALLRRTPVVLPAEGWAAGSSIDEPSDWAWRTSLVKDNRPDDESAEARPKDAQATRIQPDLIPADSEAGYVAVLGRGEKQLEAKIARSVVFASNFGLVRFTGTNVDRGVQHALIYDHPQDKKDDDPQEYTVYSLTLVSTSDSQPTIS
ncbi:hypothetical protein [Leptolyngbya sp. FACHB-711]|uniref:hypothetical protein n=1 Tax=unclassified Leptolyngbya TaxID=2650499 RepID=UPI001684622F|nr:hypothetical protein [Leptolyngbya sp. FACHB-711]MBD2024924.1 hypothetical protein [Leptolyngbya sp. FACHB-711]